MIQIRHKNGDVTEVTSSYAIEILDGLGRLAVVVTQTSAGSVRINTKGDPVFNAYANICGLKPSNVHVHEPVKEADR